MITTTYIYYPTQQYKAKDLWENSGINGLDHECVTERIKETNRQSNSTIQHNKICYQSRNATMPNIHDLNGICEQKRHLWDVETILSHDLQTNPLNLLMNTNFLPFVSTNLLKKWILWQSQLHPHLYPQQQNPQQRVFPFHLPTVTYEKHQSFQCNQSQIPDMQLPCCKAMVLYMERLPGIQQT